MSVPFPSLNVSVPFPSLNVRAEAHPKGFMAHIVSAWVVAVPPLFMVWLVLFHGRETTGERAFIATFFAFFGAVAIGVALGETWWRRVCIDGTEVIILRGSHFIHRGAAFGRVRELRRPFHDVRKVIWRPRGSPRQYVSSVAIWRGFPNMYVVGWGLDDESGKWPQHARNVAATSATGTG